MSPAAVELLVRSVVTIGEEAVLAIVRSIHAGDVDTTKQLAAVLPDADAQLLADEALIQQQRRRAGVSP